jgi:hypothetical protein
MAAAYPAGVWSTASPGNRPAFLPVSPAATLTMTIAASPALSARGPASVTPASRA